MKIACFSLVACFFLFGLCAFAQLPDPALTPGVVRTTDASEICAKDFRTKPFRLTTSQMKHQVCREYHIANCPKAKVMEIDHLLPLELGGLDDVKNLWPQMAVYPNGEPGFHVKDHLENELKSMVCAGKITLPDAQQCITSNWIECYKRVFERSKP